MSRHVYAQTLTQDLRLCVDLWRFFLDQELIVYRYSSCSSSSSCWRDIFNKSLIKSDRDEFWQQQQCSSRKYAAIDGVSRIFDLTSHFQDGGQYVISHRKVLPPGA